VLCVVCFVLCVVCCVLCVVCCVLCVVCCVMLHYGRSPPGRQTLQRHAHGQGEA
jgi:hypothetical protein